MRFLFFLLLFTASHAMEPEKKQISKPQLAITVPNIRYEFEQEKRRFESYGMENKTFIPQLNEKLGIQNDYAQQLVAYSTFIKAIYFQHELMKRVAQYNEYAFRSQILAHNFQKLVEQLGTIKEQVLFETGTALLVSYEKINSPEVQATFLRIAPILAMQSLHESQAFEIAREILPDLLLSDNNQIVLIGNLLLNNMEDKFFLSSMRRELKSKMFKWLHSNLQSILSLTRTLVHGKPLITFPFFKKNLHFLYDIFDAVQEIPDILALGKGIIQKKEIEFNQKLLELAMLYERLQPFYIRLYELFYNYIKETVRDPATLKILQEKYNLKIIDIFLGWNNEEKKPIGVIPQKLQSFGPINQTSEFFPLQEFLKPILEKRKQEILHEEQMETQRRKEKAHKKREARKLEKEKQKIEKPAQEIIEEPESIEEAAIPSYKAEDGSFVESENKVSIDIQDPKNKITVELFKRLSEQETKRLGIDIKGQVTIKLPFTYNTNVQEWFENPEQALADQGYLDPAKKRYAGTPAKKREMIVYHSFAKEVDTFILKNGFQASTPSRQEPGIQDILISISGAIVMDGKRITGLFTYLINAKGVCYHRMFTPEEFNKQVNDLMSHGLLVPEMKELYEVHFPPLGAKK